MNKNDKLIQLRDRALKNAAQQKRREITNGRKRIRVRYTEWLKIAEQYNNQIKNIVLNKS